MPSLYQILSPPHGMPRPKTKFQKEEIDVLSQVNQIPSAHSSSKKHCLSWQVHIFSSWLIIHDWHDRSDNKDCVDQNFQQQKKANLTKIDREVT